MANLVLNGKSIDTLEEIAENFITDEVLAAVCDGTLVAWLEEFGYDKELSRIRSIPVGLDNDGIVSQIIVALGLSNVECLAANDRNTTKKSACSRNVHERNTAMPLSTQKDSHLISISSERESSISGQERKIQGEMVEPKLDSGADAVLAIQAYQKDAEAGNALAQYYLALCFHRIKNYVEARRWYEKAAWNGCADAQDRMGDFYNVGLIGVDEDIEEAIKWYEKASRNGCLHAQYMLGCCYCDDSIKDYDKGVQWLFRAANQGYGHAQKTLGDCYFWGRGVPKDHAEAVRRYKMAAEQGCPEALEILKRRFG